MPAKTAKSAQMVVPSDAPACNPTAPSQDLKLQSVLGYAGQIRGNIALNAQGDLVYPAAAVGVIQKKDGGRQTFHLGHTNDISAFGTDASGRIVATGDMCSLEHRPEIRVWNAETGALLASIPSTNEKRKAELCHQLQKQIACLAVSPNGTKIAAAGGDSNHHVCLLSTTNNWRSYKREFLTPSSTNEVLFAAWFDDNVFYTGGEKHLLKWTVGASAPEKCLFGCCPIDSLCSACRCDEMFAVGTKSGSVYFYKGTQALFSKKVHEKAVTALIRHPDGGLVSGGMDYSVMMWNKSGMPLFGFDLLQVLKLLGDTKTVIGGVNALVYANASTLLVGTKKCNILSLTLTGKKVTAANVLVSGHAPGEVWGCSAHPRDGNVVVSTGDDQRLFVWDVAASKPLKQLTLPRMSRTVDIHPTKDLVAIGLGGRTGTSQAKECDDGGFMVVDLATMAPVFKQEKMSEEWISAIKFSPNGKYLAVASHDNLVYVYDTEAAYKLLYKFAKGVSFAMQVDFSEDSQYAAVCYGDYQLLYFRVADGQHVVSPKDLSGVHWATQNCTFGWAVQGIWHATADRTDINACAVSPDHTLLVAVDDFNTVRLYRYPASEESCEYKKFYGHASHIPYCEFSFDGKKVVTVGGNDHTVMVWEVVA